MLKINRDTALQVLEAVVNEAGSDFIYRDTANKACEYEAGGKPSCIVGHALVKAGVPVSVLILMDRRGDSSIDSEDLEEVFTEHEIVISPDALSVFAEAQAAQDTTGTTWGNALARSQSIRQEQS